MSETLTYLTDSCAWSAAFFVIGMVLWHHLSKALPHQSRQEDDQR